jgi:hypothetical protein
MRWCCRRVHPGRGRWSVVVLASVWGVAEGLVHKVALLDGELVEVTGPGGVAEEKVRSLSSSSAEGARQLVASEIKH